MTIAISTHQTVSASLTIKERDAISPEARKAVAPFKIAGSNNAQVRRMQLMTAYQQAIKAERERHPGISDENAQHNALVHVIMANRELFPQSGFTLSHDTPGGGSYTTHIPAVGEREIEINLDLTATSSTVIGFLEQQGDQDFLSYLSETTAPERPPAPAPLLDVKA